MKKINLAFGIISAAVMLAGIVHSLWVYLSWLAEIRAGNYFSGAPAEVAFLWLIPYALGVVVLLFIWLIVWLVYKRKERAQNDAG